ncbi:spatacsin-like isoform X3 [Oculina patagonica]
MATSRSLPVILKKFDQSFDPGELKAAEVSRKCRVLATLGTDCSLKLWNIRSDANCTLTCVTRFKWSLDRDYVDQNHLEEDHFAAVKSDGSILLYSISMAFEDFSSSCDAVVGKDLLKGLLHDRGKDCPCSKVHLVSVSQSAEPSKHEVSLLVDNKFVTVLSMAKSTAPDIVVFFDVKSTAATKENIQVALVKEVRRCHKFFFTLLSNGVVLIHNMGDFVGSVNVWPLDNLTREDNVSVQERPSFTHLEVADDLSFLVCADAASNVYLINLDEYFEDFPSQLLVPVSFSVRGSSVGALKFQYELGDEDSVARDVEMSGITYGDRVWKTELLAFRRDAKQSCLRNISDVRSVCMPSVKKRWFSGLVSPYDGNIVGAFSSCGKQPLTDSSRVSGFRAKQREAAETTVEEFTSTACDQKTHFIQCKSWMEMFTLEGVSLTPASFLLNLKPKRRNEEEGHPSDVSHGALCLYSFKTKEYVYHWLSEPSVIVQSCEAVYPPLLLTSKSLAVPAFDISQDQLVHKVIMYENAGLADSLCFVNQWDHCTIPIHALEVALKLRQLDTVAFFLKNQDKAFTNRCTALFSSSSSLSSPSSSLSECPIGTTDVEAVTEALVRAVNYNMQQQHYQHFTRQLAQMTLSYLHNLMEDGAKLIEGEDLHDSFGAAETGHVACTPFYQEIKNCLEFLTQSVVKLRCHLTNMPSLGSEKLDSTEGSGQVAFRRIEMDEEDGLRERWIKMSDEEVVEDAIVNRQISSAQTFFQSRREDQMSIKQEKVQCDGSLSSIIEVGLKVVLQKLLQHDMETVVTMLTNMGRDVLQQLHKICLYTLHRPLRDFLANELESRDVLSPEEMSVVDFVHTLESMYSQQSFAVAKENLGNSDQKDRWRDLGLLRSSFNLGSTQILDTYIKTNDLVQAEINKQNLLSGSNYVELPLTWVCSWGELSRQRILIERMLTCKAEDSGALSHDVEITAEALWNYLSSHTNWKTLLGWIRSMALDIDTASDDPTLYVGEKFAVHGGDVVLPPLPRWVFSQAGSSHKVVREMILEELTRNGMFTASQLSNFSLLLHYLSTTQTLFGDNPPLFSLNGGSGGGSDDSLNAKGCLVSISQFHQSFIDYCVRLKLVNLLYHYLDFYGLCESVEGVKELKLDSNRPHWVDMLIKCRLLGRNCKDPDAVFQASLAMAGFMLNMESPSVTNILKAGHPVMAVSSLLYGPNTLSQAIISSESQPNIPVWQVEDKLLHESLMNFPKVHSAVFPVTSGTCGIERQDVSVYKLLQGNSPFEISRLFGWQPTNELAPKGDTTCDMPHFSNDLLVSQHAHVEKLTFSYYLRHGRPSFAFVSFVGEKLKDATVSKAKIQQAALKAYRVAVQHLTNSSVCAACVAFTEMLGLDSTPLRVDIQAANRLMAHAGLEDLLGDETKEDNTMEDAITSELLSCAGKSNQKPERLLTALKTATRNLISKECLDKTSFEAGQHWNFVVLFCRVHKMEFPVTFLQDCARADKWLPFVCHAQACQFPKEQVVYVIEHDFSNAFLQEHLHLAFDNVQLIKIENASSDELTKKRSRKKKLVRTGEQPGTPSRDVRAQFYSRMGLVATTVSQTSHQSIKEEPVTRPSCSSSAEDEETSKAKYGSEKELNGTKIGHDTDDRLAVDSPEVPLGAEEVPHNLFDILFKCQSVEVPWRHLLAHSITLHRSLLSALAACFKDSKPLDCLCAWLCSTVRPSVLENAVATISELQWHEWTQEDLTALVLAFVETREKLAHTLAKAFYIFDPASPLVNFFHFHETFLVHCDYDACREYLNSFKISYNKLSMKVVADKHMDVLRIGTLEWLEKLTSQVTKHMLTHCESAHQQRHLLAILARTMFGINFSCKVPDYYELHEVSTVLHGTDTDMRLEVMLEQGNEDSQAEKERVLLSLLNTKHFAEARKFAELVKLSGDHITRKEVEAELENAKNSMLWEIEQGRLAFWHRAEKCFRDHGCKPDTVGTFFENQASDTGLSFTERAMLLGIAVKWFSNVPADQQQKTPEELKELQKKRWLFKIRAEIEKDFEGHLTRSVSHLEFLSHETEMELLSEIKPANVEAVTRKAVNLKELVQDDTATVKNVSDCPLETDKEIRALEKVIGDLLEGCHVSQAKWLANLFNHSCLELDVVLSCIYLAQGTRFVDTLDDNIQTLLSRKAQRRESLSSSTSPFRRSGSFIFTSTFTEKTTDERHDSVSSADWVKVEDIIATMESLAFHCKQGKRCCTCVITCYRVAQTLGQDYETIVNKKPLSVLHSLLLSGFDSRYKLMESYIKAIQLDTVEVTQFLADIILNSLRVHSTGEDISGREYSDLTVNAAPSCEDISQMIRLCPDYSLLGGRLLDTATSLANERATGTTLPGVLNLEVELLVRAHECHTLACNMEGIAAVLRNGRVLTTALAETRDYMLMVRLLTGVGRFNEMSYIFDTLFEHEHFELLCRRGIDKENKLKVALLEYLRRQHPDDTDKFSMVAHHFSMYREIAQTLEETAVKQLAGLGDCFPGT